MGVIVNRVLNYVHVICEQCILSQTPQQSVTQTTDRRLWEHLEAENNRKSIWRCINWNSRLESRSNVDSPLEEDFKTQFEQLFDLAEAEPLGYTDFQT